MLARSLCLRLIYVISGVLFIISITILTGNQSILILINLFCPLKISRCHTQNSWKYTKHWFFKHSFNWCECVYFFNHHVLHDCDCTLFCCMTFHQSVTILWVFKVWVYDTFPFSEADGREIFIFNILPIKQCM